MDVIEDLHTVLRIVLDYIGLDIDDVGEYLAHLNRRQRLAIQDLRHFVAEGWNRNITRPRVHMVSQWHHWRSDIRHKSLIRIIGTSLPLKPPKRLKISSHMLRPRRRHNSCDSDYSLNSITSTCPSTDEDMVWVEEDLGDNCIRVRAQKREDLSDCEEGDIPDDLSDDMFINRNNVARSPLNSTMISSVSMVSSCDPETMSKIGILEDELTALRKQIAMLVMTQEQNRSQAIPNNSTFTKVEDISTTVDHPVISPEIPVVPAPPPPPPPPATPKTVNNRIMVSNANTPKSEDSNVEQVDTNPLTGAPAKAPTLTDVLKGLHSVKLRSVQRSPGGTPMKVKCPKVTNHCDPASLIAQALKKKFANHHVYSPEVDKENENPDFSSPEYSPRVVQKKVKRRSILFEDRRKSSGPLREVNA